MRSHTIATLLLACGALVLACVSSPRGDARATRAPSGADPELDAFIANIRAVDNHSHANSVAPGDADADALPSLEAIGEDAVRWQRAWNIETRDVAPDHQLTGRVPGLRLRRWRGRAPSSPLRWCGCCWLTLSRDRRTYCDRHDRNQGAGQERAARSGHAAGIMRNHSTMVNCEA